MAKKYWTGKYDINTNWGGDETTDNLPLPGSAVQDVIKTKLKDLDSSKVGYIVESNGTVYFSDSIESYNEGKYMGEVISTQRYSMFLKEDEGNKHVFLSSDSKKEFVWYFKTVEIATGNIYEENVVVEYRVKNTSNATDKLISTTINCLKDNENEGYTKVVLNLDEYLENGNSTIEISVKGVRTNQEYPLSTSISIITLMIEDETAFNTLFYSNFTVNTNVTCTRSQIFYYEYRIDEIGNFILDTNHFTGNGEKQNIDYSVNIENLADGKHVFEYRILVKLDTNVDAYYTDTQRIEFIKGDGSIFTEPQVLIFSTYGNNDKPLTDDGELIIHGVTQYVPYDIKCAIFNPEISTTNAEFYEIISTEIDGVITEEETNPILATVNNGKFYYYTVQAMENTQKKIKVVCRDNNENIINGDGRIFYINIIESTFGISEFKTSLRANFTSVGKSNNSVDREVWISEVSNGASKYIYDATFSDTFDWSQGWTDNGLVLCEGCEVTLNYSPFPLQKENPSGEEIIEYVGGDRAYTLEFEFMTQNVTDENAVLCDMMDEREGGQCGILITGSEFRFTTPGGSVINTRFKSDEMTRIGLVIRPKTISSGVFKGLVELYVNGILSNIIGYQYEDKFQVLGKDEKNNTVSKKLSFKGAEGADLVLKYVRAYNTEMTPDDMVDNYIIYRTDSKEMMDLYNKNNITNEDGVITPDSVLKLGEIPILVFVGRTVNDELATGDGNETANEEYMPGSVDANSENHYETLEGTTDKKEKVDMDVIYYNPKDKTKNFKFVKAYITPQGTSSMYYPKKNYRIYTQKNSDTRMFLSTGNAGVLEFDQMIKSNFGESEADRKYEFFRGKENKSKRLYSFKNNAQAVKCWCLKADFAETSSSHNTGIARLWGETLKESTVTLGGSEVPVFKTNAQVYTERNYINDKENMPDIRTTVDGFPIVVFGKKSYNGRMVDGKLVEDPFVFLGKYNFNNDKSTESVFGFCDIDNNPENSITDSSYNYDDNTSGTVVHTLDAQLDQYMTCVETLDNGNALANFTTLNDFDSAWDKAFEFRYPEPPEGPDEKDYKDSDDNWLEGGEEEYNADSNKFKTKTLPYWENTHLKPFKHFAQWVYETGWCDVNGNILPGLTEEEAAARKERFAKEKWDHLDVWKMAAYYIYIMRFGAVDQVVKNSMLTSEGPFAFNINGAKYGVWDSTPETSENYGKYYKWYYINYDNDTILGVKNDGHLAYGPEITRKDLEGSGSTATPIFAGYTSNLWNSMDYDVEFQNIVAIADRGISRTMTYRKTVDMFDVEQVGKWCERIYNKDAEYKYISPYVADWKYSGDSDKAENFVDKLFMLQGSRSSHRRWWLSKRFNLFDGKWSSGEFASRFVEVKCNSGLIGDTFHAIAGANAYFGYQINNNTFDVNEGDDPWMGGVTTEFKANEIVNWKLYKNINIGDPIGIFGSTDLLELNLQGISKNLSSIVFHFGTNSDLGNKLERLNISVPDSELFVDFSYVVYSDDEIGTVNGKTGFEKLQAEYDYLLESDFEEGGKYPTSDTEYDANSVDSPEFYRTEVVKADGSLTYIYFAKISGGARNYACTKLSLDSLDKLQTLNMAGYMGMKEINLTNNKFINNVDVRYGGITNIYFSEGSRIKELKASSALVSLNFTRCDNIKLNNIYIDSITLKENGGKNLNNISIDNSEGLNYDNEFKFFILKWMKGGAGYKNNSDRSLSLRGINWTNVTISDINTILNFARGNSITNENRAMQCTITGTIVMAQENLTLDDINLINTIKSFKSDTVNIELIVKIPFANIFIEGPDKIVAGDKNAVFSAKIYPENISLNNTKIDFAVSSLDSENPREIGYSWETEGEQYDNQYTQIRLESQETLEDSVEVEVIAKLISEGGSDETNTKSASMTVLVEKPTYPDETQSSIEGNLTIKVGNSYTFKVNPLDENGILSTGSYDIEWSCEGEGVAYISSAITGKDLVITVVTDVIPDENTEPAVPINVYATVKPLNANMFTLNRITQVLSSDSIISRATHPEIMNALTQAFGWDESKFAMSKDEAIAFTNDDLVTLNEYLIGMKRESTSNTPILFNEFVEFTNITKLPNNFFADSDIVEITLPKSLDNLGTVNGFNGETTAVEDGIGLFSGCSLLEKIIFPDNDFFNTILKKSDSNIIKGVIIPKYFCFGCSSLKDIELPKGTVYIDDYALGKTNIKKMAFPSGVRKIEKALISDDSGFDTTIEEITIPALCTTLNYTMFQAISLKKIKIDDTYIDESTGEVYENPYYDIDGYGCLITKPSDISPSELVRMPAQNEVYDDDGNLITEFDFSTYNFSYATIGVNAFKNNKNITKITLNAATWNKQSGLMIEKDLFKYNLKGELNDVSELPLEGNSNSDSYLINKQLYVYNDTGNNEIVNKWVKAPLHKDEVVASSENYNALFENCYNLEEINISANYMVKGSILTDRCFANCIKLKNVNLLTGLELIGENAFYNVALTSLILPDTITSLSKNAINSCDNLTNIELSKLIVSLECEGGHILLNLPKLKTLTLPYLINDIPNSFIINCPLLEEYILPNGYASYGTNIDGILEIVTHESEDDMNVFVSENTGYTPCTGYSVDNGIIYSENTENGGKKLVRIPFNVKTSDDGVLNIPNGVELIGHSAGSSLTNVKSVILPDTVKYLEADAFRSCGAITNVVMSENIENIGQSAFYENRSLTAITLPNKEITFNDQAFAMCGFKTFVFPEKTKNIGPRILQQNTSLEEVVIGKDVESLGAHPLTQCNNLRVIVCNCVEAPKCTDYTFPTDNRTPGYDVSSEQTKILYVPKANSGYTEGYWNSALLSDWDGEEGTWKPFELNSTNMAIAAKYNSSNNSSYVKVSLYEEGELFTTDEMYLIDINTGNEFVGIVSGNTYYVPQTSDLFVGETYAVKVTIDGITYTFEDKIVMDFSTLDYSVEKSNGIIEYYDNSEVLGARTYNAATFQKTVSKYEYDVLAAKINYLENILKNK